MAGIAQVLEATEPLESPDTPKTVAAHLAAFSKWDLFVLLRHLPQADLLHQKRGL